MADQVMIPMEELSKNQAEKNVVIEVAKENEEKATKLDKQQEGSSHDQPGQGATSNNEYCPSEREYKVLKKLKASNDQTAQAAKIQKVPKILRQEYLKEYYTPREMFVGPLNHDAKNFPEERKIKLAVKFLSQSEQKKETLYKKIKDNIKGLRESYLDKMDENCDDEKLELMLFVDGCSILQFMYSYVSDKLGCFEINKRIAALIQQDIFLLENQLPFEVFDMLMESAKNKASLETSIKRFIRLNVMAPANHSAQLADIEFNKNEARKPAHLLELLQLTLLQRSEDRDKPEKDEDHKASKTKLEPKDTNEHSSYKRTFRNIQDLKAAWIKLEPSESCSLRDVTFTTSRFFFAGRLKLPPLIVDDSTLRKLFNLVAFEMCPEKFQADHGVTSYLYFLDSLIDIEDDAKDLRTATIFCNRLSSDGEVSKFFNEMGRHLLPAPEYVDVKKRIQWHYDSRWMKWVAQVQRDHFNSPWTVMALVAAVMIVAMTAVQTWFAIYPAHS